MRLRGLSTLVACLGLHLTASAALPAEVTFDSLTTGTRWGGKLGDAPGDMIFAEDGISVTVENFVFGSNSLFFQAEVGGRNASSFSTPALSIDNISVAFDLSGLGFQVTEVTLEYADLGGLTNLSVNGGSVLQSDPLTDLGGPVGSGITAAFEGDNLLRLSGGAISTVQIGGQELAIDNFVVVPEPACGLLLAIGAAAALRRRRCPRLS